MREKNLPIFISLAYILVRERVNKQIKYIIQHQEVIDFATENKVKELQRTNPNTFAY